MSYKITIPGSTISKKNSKNIYVNRHTHKPFVGSNQKYKAWEDQALWSLKGHPLIGREWRYPVEVRFKFFRKSRHRFDFNNLAQGPLDVLVDIGILEDDSMEHVVPVFDGWELDKKKPRVEIEIEEVK